ncbi:hypothetical protein PVA38_11695 [Streptococcus pneumoniae D39]|nr:hypothetical protein PVA38_11695 [Streptococcus pneumoniae D39]
MLQMKPCLLYTSDAADEARSVDLGGRRIIKKKHNNISSTRRVSYTDSTLFIEVRSLDTHVINVMSVYSMCTRRHVLD